MTRLFDIPRTLLLTRWPPDGPYSGAAITRKIASRVPADRFRWAYLADEAGADEFRGEGFRAFSPAQMHWRLRGGVLEFLRLHALEAPRLARRVADWAQEFDPQLLWVASDQEGITMGRILGRLLDVPVHYTMYDATECCRYRNTPPAVVFPWYMRNAGRFMRSLRSYDAVSRELIEYEERRFDIRPPRDSAIFRVCVERETVRRLPPIEEPEFDTPLRRIGFCGSSPMSDRQWEGFLNLLGVMPLQFEIHAFARREYFHDTPTPHNVELRFLPFAPTEADVMRHFRENRVSACYMGLWKDPARALFANTSLSSKLTTYAATGLPVIVDGTQESVAWKLVERYGAGVLCGSDAKASAADLSRLFGRADAWRSMMQGAMRLYAEEFDMDLNLERLTSVFRRSAAEPRRRDRTHADE